MKNKDVIACLIGFGCLLASCAPPASSTTNIIKSDTTSVASLDAFGYPIQIYKYRDSLVTCIITDHGTSGASISCVRNK